MLAMLEAQRAYFSSDGCLRERAELWRDATPEECWAAMKEQCKLAERSIARLDLTALERMRALDDHSPATLALLEALQRESR